MYGILWDLGILTLLNPSWPRHTPRVPLAFQGYISELTQGLEILPVGWWYLLLLSHVFQALPRPLQGLCTFYAVPMEPWGQVWWSICLQYCLSFQRNLGNMFFRSSMLWTVLWPCNGETVASWSCKGSTVVLWSWKGWVVVLWVCFSVKKCVSWWHLRVYLGLPCCGLIL